MDFITAKNRAEELTALLKYHNDLYYNQDNPEISDFEYEINKDYYLKYSHNVTSQILKLEISYDGKTWATLSELTDVSIGYQGGSDEYLEIGGVAQSSNHYFSCGKINLFRSYILTDDELFWGVKYN